VCVNHSTVMWIYYSLLCSPRKRVNIKKTVFADYDILKLTIWADSWYWYLRTQFKASMFSMKW